MNEPTAIRPHFPPAPERLLSLMVDNLQQLGARAQGLSLAPTAAQSRWEEFAPSTRTALVAAMSKATSTKEAA